jgi:riboflavin synthase
MFTGIVQNIGSVVKIVRNKELLQITIRSGLFSGLVKTGDSIALNGVCLTVTSSAGSKSRRCGMPAPTRRRRGEEKEKYYLTPKNLVSFDVMPETIRRTTLGKLKVKDKVNIEPSLRVGETLSGHFVQGHIDTVGVISEINKKGADYLMRIQVPSPAPLIEKGSVAVDGVSLTVIDIKYNTFSVELIPFTLMHTTLGTKKVSDSVNIEFDIIGKWVKKLLSGKETARYSDDGF